MAEIIPINTPISGRKANDLTGQKFNMLTVVRRDFSKRWMKPHWECLCDCGETTVAKADYIRSGQKRSCGCDRQKPAKADLVGRRFRRLTVIERVGAGKNNQVVWLCRCDCGNTTTLPTGRLVTKNPDIHSCGCYRSSKAVGRRQRQWLGGYKRQAGYRGLAWELSDEEANAIFESPCRYCNMRGSSNLCELNGIDRIDSSLGYVPGNVVPCCKFCNYAKRDMTEEQFRAWVQRVYEFYAAPSGSA